MTLASASRGPDASGPCCGHSHYFIRPLQCHGTLCSPTLQQVGRCLTSFILMPYHSWLCESLDAEIFEEQKLQLLFRIIFFSKFLFVSYIAGRFRKTNQYVYLTLPQQELFRRLGLGHFPRSGESISQGLSCQSLLPSWICPCGRVWFKQEFFCAVRLTRLWPWNR